MQWKTTRIGQKEAVDMQELKDRVIACGLEINEQETIHVAEHGAFVADYIYKNGKIIARYIFTQVTYETFEIKMHEHSSFTKNVIEPIFYGLRNDLRWNLNLVCIMEVDEFGKLPDNEKIKFHSNKDFTRNIVIPIDKIEEEIPIGKQVLCGSTGHAKIEADNPLSIWSRHLGEELQFCLDGFETNKVNSYMEGRSIHLIPSEKLVSTHHSTLVHRINSIQLTDYFRPHCFGAMRELPLSQVNIMAGVNGSGKTSILQAIELIMTGEVRTSEKGISAVESNSGLSLWHNNIEKKMSIPQNAKDKKTRQSWWYKDRSGAATAQRLNNSFHRFNMFTPEDVFRASFSKEKEDYIDIFTKMLFGEEAEAAQKSWQGYEKAFKRECESKAQELDSIQHQLKLLEFPNEIKKEGMLKNMDVLGLQVNPDVPMEELRDVVIRLKNMCYATTSYPEIKTQEHVSLQLSEKKRKIEMLNVEIEAKKAETAKASRLMKEAKTTQEDLAVEANGIAQMSGALQNAQSYQQGFRFIAENYDELRNLDKKNEERYAALDKSNDANKFIHKYGYIDALTGVYADYEASCFRHEITLTKQQKAQDEKNKLQDEYNLLERSKNAIDKAVSNIKAYGNIYIEAVHDFKGCPLCGNQGITIDEFKTHLNAETNDAHDEMYRVSEKLLHLEAEITDRSDEITRLHLEVERRNQIDAAFGEVPQIHVDESQAVSDKLEVVQSYIEFCKNCINQLDMLERETSTLEAYYTDAAPQRVKSMLTNENYVAYVVMIENSLGIIPTELAPIPQRISQLFAKMQIMQGELDELQLTTEQRRREISAVIENLEQTTKRISEEIEANEKIRKSTQNEIAELENLDVFFRTLYEHMNPNISMIDRTAFANQCAALEQSITDYLTQQKSFDECKTLENKMHDLKTVQNRLHTALEALSKLSDTKQYSDAFILENIDRISGIFHALHTPREFIKLKIVDGEMCGVRIGGSQSVAISRMSTGQKTAVALSIFLLLNSSMTTIPNFILVDEPIANIDDLNILSFIDVIRELAICSGKQVFFTTANDNVRKLFRRKFSFLGEEFSEFNFKRIDNMKAQITIKKYDEVRELTDRRRDISFVESVDPL